MDTITANTIQKINIARHNIRFYPDGHEEIHKTALSALKLLNRLFELAREENCKRVRWQVSHWNTTALEFYKSIGAVVCGEEYNCDFGEAAIRGFTIKT